MAFPKILKNARLDINGVGFIGIVSSVTLPKIARKMEEVFLSGMIAPVDVAMGFEKLEATVTMPGFGTDIMPFLGEDTLSGVKARFTGAAESDDTGEVDSIVYNMHGRFKEHDTGDSKVGDLNETSAILSLSYLEVLVNGKQMLEIDPLGMIYKVNGKDVYAKIRQALGM